MVVNEWLKQLRLCHCITHEGAETIVLAFYFEVNALPVIGTISLVNTSWSANQTRAFNDVANGAGSKVSVIRDEPANSLVQLQADAVDIRTASLDSGNEGLKVLLI